MQTTERTFKQHCDSCQRMRTTVPSRARQGGWRAFADWWMCPTCVHASAMESIDDKGGYIEVADLKPGDVIYGVDTVTRVYRHRLNASKVVAETTGGEYSFPEDRSVPGGGGR